MGSQLNPYIAFPGTARQALEFYQSVFGGDLTINTYAEMGQGGGEGPDGPDGDKVMHGHLQTPQGYHLMAADVPGGTLPSGGNVSITLSGDDPELRRFWSELSQGGTVNMPFEKQVWGDEYGDCVDRFGVRWAVDLGDPQTS
jgi:PhnB protein